MAKVLVVEDDADTLEMVSRTLEKSGFGTCTPARFGTVGDVNACT